MKFGFNLIFLLCILFILFTFHKEQFLAFIRDNIGENISRIKNWNLEIVW